MEKADVLVADHIEQCVDHGEVSRFVQTDDTRKSAIVELGQGSEQCQTGTLAMTRKSLSPTKLVLPLVTLRYHNQF